MHSAWDAYPTTTTFSWPVGCTQQPLDIQQTIFKERKSADSPTHPLNHPGNGKLGHEEYWREARFWAHLLYSWESVCTDIPSTDIFKHKEIQVLMTRGEKTGNELEGNNQANYEIIRNIDKVWRYG